MRHLEKHLNMDSHDFQENSEGTNNLDELPDIKLEEMKIEFPKFILDDNLMKTDFLSDEDSSSEAHLTFDLHHDSDSSEELDSLTKCVRKNRRKAAAPQRAVQIETSQSGSMENSSESSQDNTDTLTFTNIQNLSLKLKVDSLLDFGEADELCEDLLQNINEDDIFKDLQDEADGEAIDDEMIVNVKEEWRAHWGVKCNMCEQVFPFKTEFDKHYISNYNLIPVYTCTFCNKSAEKYSTFRSHCYRHITEGRYKCQYCPKGFSLQSMLHVHILAKHTKVKPYNCEECGKTFVTKPGLKIHLKKHKTETKEDYPCVECGKVLHTRGGLTSHMNVHRLGRRFMCDVCGKTFTQKVNMQQHVKQHTGDKPHICNKCGKTFAEKSHLVRHYSFHSEVRPFKCEVCQKMYKTERCLKVHSLVHAAARPFVCGYCNKGFLSSTKLKQHYNIHTGERPYKCKYCERTFTNYPNWLKHTRRRHKVDHKTGQELQPKDEPPSTPSTPTTLPATPTTSVSPPIVNPSATTVLSSTSPQIISIGNTLDTSADIVPVLSDVNFTKAEELLLQNGLFNFPLLDDKILFSQQMDFLTANTSNSVGLLVPYFQAPLPSHQTILQHTAQTILPVQLNDPSIFQ
ncbi:zinc finger protein 300-like [Diabrotica virgifera virgifera]|uniref:C2H2-type domain-containing protein n=2 Tax=Diabrotica virgifera virgifera TaxID=50390 RepID=A0ABM5JWJ7_DIAVI|nr:zinc finger protein 300-like [Diabrotica virgifera virgifera]